MLRPVAQTKRQLCQHPTPETTLKYGIIRLFVTVQPGNRRARRRSSMQSTEVRGGSRRDLLHQSIIGDQHEGVDGDCACVNHAIVGG